MPVLKHAKKKLRQDKKRTADNLKIKKAYKKLLKVAKLEKTTEAISAAYQAIDKAAKKNILHDNKAARLKSSLTKVASGALSGVISKKKSIKATKAAKAVKTAKKAAKAKVSSASKTKATPRKAKKK